MIKRIKQWNAKRKLNKLLANQAKAHPVEMGMRANPVTINPKGNERLLRAAGRLKRLLYAVEQGDTRQSLIDEMPKHHAILAENHLEIPQSGIEAELLYTQLRNQ